ncbi:phosphatidate cytidylyltransferase, mitochondrial [Cimex lectularius]|uniref:Phosphatidate cytidylyltransferase, mitochondrial n=1 Tax=Cimex lectularius TaxID=79782 RepID=A0A8I6RP01_CIMLE|nr:phosphatidate cytidylyltransferase, mitochondrial [Cimex lectularius]
MANSALVSVVPPLFERILSIFPRQYIRFCFAYGSGVFRQGGVSMGKPMIDLIFCVNNSVGFHKENIATNPSHYSALKHLGPYCISFIQEKLPANVYFNTLVPLKEVDVVIKYGVVLESDLINDLLDWNSLYLSGRMHKPIKILEKPGDELDMPLRQNLFSALHTAFLLLPEVFSERELYHTIADFSYRGDFRMRFGEDKNKINNILDKQLLKFRKLYKPYLKTLTDYVDLPAEDEVDKPMMQDMSTATRIYHLFQLPTLPQKELVKYWRAHGGRRRGDAEDVLQDLAVTTKLSKMLEHCLSKIVLKSSIQQSLKGILTAGIFKSIQYSNKKIDKMKKSRVQAQT